MPSRTIERHRATYHSKSGDKRLALDTIEEIKKYREALFRCAPSHQGGHSDTGKAIADALELTFPIRMPELEAKAKDDGMNTDVLWPWLTKLRA